MDERSKKDTKFVNPLNDEEDDEAKQDKKNREGGSDSEFEFSDEDEEMSQNGEQVDQWDRQKAEVYYL